MVAGLAVALAAVLVGILIVQRMHGGRTLAVTGDSTTSTRPVAATSGLPSGATVPTIPTVEITVPTPSTVAPPTSPAPSSTVPVTAAPAPTAPSPSVVPSTSAVPSTRAPSTTRLPATTVPRTTTTTTPPKAANLLVTPTVRSGIVAAAEAALGDVRDLQPDHTYYGVDNTTGIQWAAAVVEQTKGADVVFTPVTFELKPGGSWTVGPSPISPGSLQCVNLPADVLASWGLSEANCSALAPDEKPVPLTPPTTTPPAPPHPPHPPHPVLPPHPGHP